MCPTSAICFSISPLTVFFSTCLQVDFYLFRIQIWDSTFHLKNAWGVWHEFSRTFQVYINDIANIIKLWLNFRGLFEIFCRIAKKNKNVHFASWKNIYVYSIWLSSCFPMNWILRKKTLVRKAQKAWIVVWHWELVSLKGNCLENIFKIYHVVIRRLEKFLRASEVQLEPFDF